MWEEKTPSPECEFWWLEASSFLVVRGAREEKVPNQMSCPGLEQPRVFMAQGPAVSVVQAEALVACCILPSRFRRALPSVVPLVHWSN